MRPEDARADRPTAAQRLAVAVGRPIPAPPTEAELRHWEAEQDRADESIAQFYGMNDAAAA